MSIMCSFPNTPFFHGVGTGGFLLSHFFSSLFRGSCSAVYPLKLLLLLLLLLSYWIFPMSYGQLLRDTESSGTISSIASESYLS